MAAAQPHKALEDHAALDEVDKKPEHRHITQNNKLLESQHLRCVQKLV